MGTWTLPALLRTDGVTVVAVDTIDWLTGAVEAAREGQLDPQLYPLLFPAMFDDLFDELDHADVSRLALCDTHQVSLSTARRAFAGDRLDTDDLMSLASLGSWVRRLAAHLPELGTAGEVFTVIHLWAVEQVTGTLGTAG
jgi:hypothetical protein